MKIFKFILKLLALILVIGGIASLAIEQNKEKYIRIDKDDSQLY
ncbi:MAG: hypothetical protein RR198_03790 [Oscillospiraceae bacterium]